MIKRRAFRITLSRLESPHPRRPQTMWVVSKVYCWQNCCSFGTLAKAGTDLSAFGSDCHCSLA
eukprot:6759057-Pyramimonas_sp.AAC.1